MPLSRIGLGWFQLTPARPGLPWQRSLNLYRVLKYSMVPFLLSPIMVEKPLPFQVQIRVLSNR
jgi:hypothetical protein